MRIYEIKGGMRLKPRKKSKIAYIPEAAPSSLAYMQKKSTKRFNHPTTPFQNTYTHTSRKKPRIPD
jgi:hypothetical protein